MRKYNVQFILVLTGLWLGWTVLTDFFVVRTLFSLIDDFFLAGSVGMALFSKLNLLEVVVASFLVGLSALNIKRSRNSILSFIISILLFSLSMFYLGFLTPKITHLTELWKEAVALKQIGIAGIADIQQEHQYWHRLYIGLDTIKMLLLLTLMSLGIFQWK